MVRQETDDLLHKRTRHTNTSLPYCKEIGYDYFPDQNKDVLNTVVKLKYRDMFFVDEEEHKPDIYDPHNIFEDDFLIVRCDLGSPYKLIALSVDYMYILVGDSRYYKKQVLLCPIQFSEFIGITVYNQYPGTIPELRGVTIRVDNGEPCYSVIIEFLKDNTIRFVLGDECFSKLFDYYDEYERDYNGDHPVEMSNYINTDGLKPLYDQTIQFIDINGGPPNCLHDLYKEIKSRRQISEMISKIMNNNKIFVN